ncbi:MAG: hypothetical protein WDO12_06900 [Pseudomonadota bacterium]
MAIPCWALLALGAHAADPGHSRIVFQGGGPRHIGLYLADADGQHEMPFLPSAGRDFNPSFSDDGQWIVFTSDRAGSADIYRVHPDGSTLERLTDSSAFDDQGALSPDGTRLAFVSTRAGGAANIWLLDLARRKYARVTRDAGGHFRPSWSPDGRWLAFSADRDMPHRRSGPDKPPPEGSGCCGWEMVQSTALYIVHPDGSNLRRLTEPDGYAGSPKWSADGKRIVFYDERGQIVAVDVDGSRRDELTSSPARKWSPQFIGTTVHYLASDNGRMMLADTSGATGPDATRIWSPAWSADGKRVVYARGEWGEIPDGRAIEPIGPVDREFDFYRATRTQSWSPDGRKILFAPPFEGTPLLQVMNADGSDRHTLYDTKDPATGIVFPVWSPDGQSIVFTLGRYGSRNPVTPAQLARVNADGSGLQLLTHGDSGSGYPSFAPDGKQLVFRMLGKEPGLRILSLDTGQITAITHEADNFPAWSPRGDRILFTSMRSGDFEMYSIKPDGSGLRQLTHDHGNDAHGAWSPDGRLIIFTATDSGWKDETRLPSNDIQSNGELVVMRADGTHRRQLTDDLWEQAVTAWLPAAH